MTFELGDRVIFKEECYKTWVTNGYPAWVDEARGQVFTVSAVTGDLVSIEPPLGGYSAWHLSAVTLWEAPTAKQASACPRCGQPGTATSKATFKCYPLMLTGCGHTWTKINPYAAYSEALSA